MKLSTYQVCMYRNRLTVTFRLIMAVLISKLSLVHPHGSAANLGVWLHISCKFSPFLLRNCCRFHTFTLSVKLTTDNKVRHLTQISLDHFSLQRSQRETSFNMSVTISVLSWFRIDPYGWLIRICESINPGQVSNLPRDSNAVSIYNDTLQSAKPRQHSYRAVLFLQSCYHILSSSVLHNGTISQFSKQHQLNSFVNRFIRLLKANYYYGVFHY